MALPPHTYIDPAAGSDHEGAAFIDGSFANATNTLTKVGAFASTVANDKLFLSDNGSGEVTTAMYTVASKTDNDNIVLTTDIRSGAPDPTDVVLGQGTGGSGAPYATLQHGFDNTTQNADGDQFNVKSDQAVGVTTTTDDTLTAALDVTGTYGTPTVTAPIVIKGYTAVANDGGVGGIDLAATYALFSQTNMNAVWIADMHIHNAGAATIATVSDYCRFINCEIDETTGNGLVFSTYGEVTGCNIHNIGTFGITAGTHCNIDSNYFKNGANIFTIAVSSTSGNIITRNVFSLTSTSSGILVGNSTLGGTISHNSMLSVGGAAGGKGIVNNSATTITRQTIVNNLIEGFVTAGINYNSSDRLYASHGNGLFNNTAQYVNIGDHILIFDNDDEELASTPFAKSGSDTFANRFVYFRPLNVGNVRAGAYPAGACLDKGAVQMAGATANFIHGKLG